MIIMATLGEKRSIFFADGCILEEVQETIFREATANGIDLGTVTLEVKEDFDVINTEVTVH